MNEEWKACKQEEKSSKREMWKLNKIRRDVSASWMCMMAALRLEIWAVYEMKNNEQPPEEKEWSIKRFMNWKFSGELL